MLRRMRPSSTGCRQRGADRLKNGETVAGKRARRIGGERSRSRHSRYGKRTTVKAQQKSPSAHRCSEPDASGASARCSASARSRDLVQFIAAWSDWKQDRFALPRRIDAEIGAGAPPQRGSEHGTFFAARLLSRDRDRHEDGVAHSVDELFVRRNNRGE